MSKALDILDKLYPRLKKADIEDIVPISETTEPIRTTSDFSGYGPRGRSAPIVNILYNGETSLGEMGPAIKHIIDHGVLGQRAWQLDLESETSHTIIKQKGKWKIGTGLRLQCEPQVEVLKLFGITLQREEFNKSVEALWKVHANKSRVMDYANRVSLHKIAKRVEKNAAVWGYVLVVHRVNKNDVVTTQLIDGQHIMTPIGLAVFGGSASLVDNQLGYDYEWTNGNRIRNGVEIDDTGQHIAYHVRNGIGFTYERIPARNSKGLLMAYLVYGSEFRLDNTCGIPDITPNMEGSKQLDDYTVATVGSALERQRISYFITTEKGNEDIDPRAKNLAKIVGTDGHLDLPRDINGKQLANDIAVTTNKQTFLMGAGQDVKSPESKQELHYKEFHDTRFYAQCAAIGIPPEVASQLYGGSYSASRAATNGWQYMLNIDRSDFGDQFYQNVYNLQLLVWILAGKIQAPGYLEAFYKGNEVILAAYNYANWQGDPVPQIDQLKEVQAARLLLGIDSGNMPLSTFEKVVMDLGHGDAKANLQQYSAEMEEGKKCDIEKILPKGASLEPEEDPEENTGKPEEKKKIIKKK